MQSSHKIIRTLKESEVQLLSQLTNALALVYFSLLALVYFSSLNKKIAEYLERTITRLVKKYTWRICLQLIE